MEEEVVERIRTLLARFPEDEEAVRQLVPLDVSFDVLCNEYGKVISSSTLSRRTSSCSRRAGPGWKKNC